MVAQEGEVVTGRADETVDVNLRLPAAVVRQLRRRALELSEASGKLRTWNSIAREVLTKAAAEGA